MDIEDEYEIYDKYEWISRQLNINEDQVRELFIVKEREKFKSYFFLISTCISFISLGFFTFVFLSPNGEIYINHNLFQFTGVFSIFSIYIFYMSVTSYYEHNVILKEVKEYIEKQLLAIDKMKHSLYYASQKMKDENVF